MFQILDYFHHIHHNDGGHEVHHCGGEHKKIDEKVDYEIKHCSCGKHSISKERAIGHGFDYKEAEFIFNEKCPEEGWHIESGRIIEKD